MLRRPTTNTAPRAEEGTILIWALFIVILTSGMVVSHSTFLKASKRQKTTRHVHGNLGEAFARSGATEALNWFRRRSLQPITVFDPALDPTGNPPRLETIDPTIGLVREFEIQGSLWGRYEIRHEEAKEISAECGDGLPPGSVWEIGVRSYIYRKVDTSVPFDAKPNRLMSTNTLTTQFRFPQINPPAAAALCAEQPAKVDIGPMATLDGGTGAAIAYKDPSTLDVVPAVTTTNVDSAATVTGAQAELAVATYDADAMRVISMNIDDVRSFADYVIQPTTKVPQVNGVYTVKNAIVLHPNGFKQFLNYQWDFQNVLVYVGGDFVLGNGMTKLSKLSGMIYVDGDAYIDGNVELTGVLIVRGEAHIGKGTNPVSIEYDPATVEKLRRHLNKYRKRRGKGPSGRGPDGGKGGKGGKGK